MPRALFGPKSLNGLSGNIHRQGARQTKSNQSWVCVPSYWADSMSARVWVWVCTIVATHSHSVARQIHYNFPLPFSPLSLFLSPPLFLSCGFMIRACQDTRPTNFLSSLSVVALLVLLLLLARAYTTQTHTQHTHTLTDSVALAQVQNEISLNAPQCVVFGLWLRTFFTVLLWMCQSVCMFVCVWV